MRRGILIASGMLVFSLSSGTAFAQAIPPMVNPGEGRFSPGKEQQLLDPRRTESLEAAQEPFEIQRRAQRRPIPAALSDIAAGSEVRDRNVAFLGTIASVDQTAALVRHAGGQTVAVPLSAFWKLDGHLLLGVTRSDFSRIVAAHAARSEDEATDDQAD